MVRDGNYWINVGVGTAGLEETEKDSVREEQGEGGDI